MVFAKQEIITPSILEDVPLTATSAVMVDLQAIQHNYFHTKKHLKDECQIAAVVKADSYGLGMNSVA